MVITKHLHSHCGGSLPAWSCSTLCGPKDFNPPGSSRPGTFQAGPLQWAAISSSREPCPPRDGTCVSCISWVGKWIPYHGATWEASGGKGACGTDATSCLPPAFLCCRKGTRDGWPPEATLWARGREQPRWSNGGGRGALAAVGRGEPLSSGVCP